MRDTQVPVIKMKFDGVDIDMLFARVEYKQVGQENLGNLLDLSLIHI